MKTATQIVTDLYDGKREYLYSHDVDIALRRFRRPKGFASCWGYWEAREYRIRYHTVYSRERDTWRALKRNDFVLARRLDRATAQTKCTEIFK